MQTHRLSTLLTIAILASFSPGAQAQSDPLAATSAIDSAAASPLREITVVTGDAPAAHRFYAQAVGMTARPLKRLAAGEARLLGINGITAATLFAPRGAASARVRILAPARAPSPLRPAHVALVPGGLAIGLPVADQQAREAIVTAAGFGSVVGVTTMSLPRGDGSSYTVGEIHYRAPDGVIVLGIDRGTMPPVGPIDPATGIGGPAYASMVVADLAASERFMRDVLRFEKRRDAVFTSAGPKGGLGLADGQRFAFQQWFAPGTATGYVILMQMLGRPAGPAPPRAPHSGIVMLGFDVADLGAAATRAAAAGFRLIARPRGDRESLILAMPDGMLIELRKSEAGA